VKRYIEVFFLWLLPVSVLGFGLVTLLIWVAKP